MELFLDISLGIGLATAAGVRPVVALLVAGISACANLGIDLAATDYAFVESWPFLGAIAVVGAVFLGVQSAVPNVRRRITSSGGWMLAAVAAPFGAILFAASLAAGGSVSWPGLIAGAAISLLSSVSVAPFLAGARQRLGEEGFSWTLWLFSAAAAALIAALAITLPPASYLVVIGLAWLFAGRRRRESEKYAGLRVLR